MFYSLLLLLWAVPTTKGRADIGDGHLYYEITGKGPDLILLHGHSFDHRQWQIQQQSLSQTFRVITYDLRGYGQSDMPVEGKAFLHAEDLYQLMRVLRISKAHLVGLSLGGFVVTDFLALHPDKLLSATVTGGAVFNVPGPDQAITEAEIKQRREEIQQLRQKGLTAFKQEWLDGLVKGAAHPERVKPLLETMIHDWSAWQPQHIEPRALLGSSVVAKLRARPVTVPVLVLIGDHDSPYSCQSMEALIEVVPGARKEIVNQAGHVANVDNPAEFDRHLENFLGAIEQTKH